MSNKVKPKAAAAKYGCLSTRQWQDIRRAARLASSEGITLIMHGVSVIPTTRDSENLSQSENNSTTTSARGGRGLQPKESIGKACENPSAKQLHEQQLTKQQREQERSLRRLHDFQQAFACGARWEPLVQKLLRKERAISRAQVWTAHMERRLAMREKMRAFLLRPTRSGDVLFLRVCRTFRQSKKYSPTIRQSKQKICTFRMCEQSGVNKYCVNNMV